MRRVVRGLALLLAISPLAVLVPGQSAVPAANPADYDTFGLATVNAVAGGVEQPLTTAGSWSTGSVDTTGFTEQLGETPATCPPNTTRTAWIRVNPGVDGMLRVVASAPYSGVVALVRANQAPYGAATLADVTGTEACTTAMSIGDCGPSAPCQHVSASSDYYVLIATTTGSGGPTQVIVQFVPDDADKDGVPDPLDVCPSVAGQASAAGCPDTDQDGVANAVDDCPQVPGVTAPAPYDGCPPGPTPPTAESYVRVSSLTGNADTTNDLAVRLALSWPAGAQRAWIATDGGVAVSLPVAAAVDWQLPPVPAHQPQAVRTVTVTYRGPGIADTTRTDSIVLDTQAPRVPLQRLFDNGKGWFVVVNAGDLGTGLARILLLSRRATSMKEKVVCQAIPCASSTAQVFFTRLRPGNVRVTDAAGNAKAVRLVRRATSCSPRAGEYPVFEGLKGGYDCYSAGDRCTPDDGHYWNKSGYVRCRKLAGRFRVVER